MTDPSPDARPRHRLRPARPLRTRRFATAAGVGLLAWLGTAGSPVRIADETPTYADMGAVLARHYPSAAGRATELVRIVHEEADRQHLDPCLVMGLIAMESSFRVQVRNRSDLGLMQLNTDWHAERVARAGGPQALMEPRRNVRAGTEVLADYRSRSRSDHEALQRYHGLGKRSDYPGRVEAMAKALRTAGACVTAPATNIAGDRQRIASR